MIAIDGPEEVRAGAYIDTYGDWKILGPADRAASALNVFFVENPCDRAKLEVRIGQDIRAVTFDQATAARDRDQTMHVTVDEGEDISVRLASKRPGDRAVIRIALV